MAYRGKRALDLSVAVPALVLTLPVQAVVAGLVRLRLGRPVLFHQTRPGRGGRPFRMVKFRTMRPVDPGRGWTTDASRMTPFGTWLRSTSLDELPALVNVVRGEMSLVGPRPLLMQYLERYSPEQARRHEVLPGLTGLAQVSGRNALDWPARLRLDVQYVDECSLALDLRILGATIRSVVLRRGITAEGEATVGEFLGASAGNQAP
jgi:lipopolysaccharide/colanic/teichoic acid biosynthesis glycosyltransferase